MFSKFLHVPNIMAEELLRCLAIKCTLLSQAYHSFIVVYYQAVLDSARIKV